MMLKNFFPFTYQAAFCRVIHLRYLTKKEWVNSSSFAQKKSCCQTKLKGCNMRREHGVSHLLLHSLLKLLLNVPNPVVLDIDVCALGMSIGIIYCYTGCLKASVEGGSISLGTKEYANED
ncbi:uncharacterized protein LOC107457633 [Arachis duranensis]|uniref:Uncharacterized protein LOC107457633 n=1 Tax=Arachis duranensis TaxID=130453 RepID=A0A9C6TFN4_ARADU|nr:uncharacterized protein LOC107457633 [Arachis duranensis]